MTAPNESSVRAEQWAKPSEDVDGLDVAFGVRALNLMPPYDQELRDWARTDEGRRWARVQADWFFSGLREPKWTPREGIETRLALRHLAAIQSSWEPKHEHKEAGVAYLMSLWFEDVTYTTRTQS